MPTRAKQGGETQSRWDWVEASVWTERMLNTLETGIKGGKWYSLMDKVTNPRNMYNASERVIDNQGGPGVDQWTVLQFERERTEQLDRLEREIKEGSYQPLPALRKWIPKPGSTEKRPLGIPVVKDRVAQTALRNVIEPIFEVGFCEQSYGFRPGRGCKGALKRVDALLKRGQVWVVDADLKSYFDTIPHEKLMERVEERIADGGVLTLIRSYLKQGVMEELKGWQPTEQGTPQGAVISPLLANVYLNPLDHQMQRNGHEMVRYADDFVILCESEEQAGKALAEVREWTEANGLTLHPQKTRIVDATERGGFDFLGYHFERGMKWPREKSEKKLREAIREHTRRTNGKGLEEIIQRINLTLRGWFGYFKHSHKTTFAGQDKWVRMRLRSILRKRRKGKGRGRGADHQRWPNAFFTAHGLYSLEAAHTAGCQSR